MLDSPEVTIVAGSGDLVKEFILHQDLLCHYSAYFTGAFRHPFEEAVNRRFVFTDISPAVVKAFRNWAYFGILAEPKAFVDANSSNRMERTSVALQSKELAEIWIFGDRMGVPGLQNAAIDQMYQRSVECGGHQANLAELVYSSTPPGSTLRRYLVDQTVYQCRVGEASRTLLTHCADFLFDICTRFSELYAKLATQRTAPWEPDWLSLDMSQYHVKASRDEQKERLGQAESSHEQSCIKSDRSGEGVITIDLSE